MLRVCPSRHDLLPLAASCQAAFVPRAAAVTRVTNAFGSMVRHASAFMPTGSRPRGQELLSRLARCVQNTERASGRVHRSSDFSFLAGVA